jgi:hypothetical protein
MPRIYILLSVAVVVANEIADFSILNKYFR